jgi:hypothetical protein
MRSFAFILLDFPELQSVLAIENAVTAALRSLKFVDDK